MAEKLTEQQLGAIVAQQIELAKGHDKHARATPRAKALDYFFGNMDAYVPPEPNRSKVVSRDVADTIGWMLPGIMRVFTASDRMAVAEPVGAEDVDFADQATDGMNYVFWKDNKGYEIVYAATWDSLLHGNGIVKTYYDDTPVYSTSFHSGLTDDQRVMLLEDDETEVLAASSREVTIPGPEGDIAIEVHDLKIKRKKLDGKFIVTVIPTEEFLISENAVATDDAPFTAHWQKITRSELVAMGYDKDEVWKIPAAGRPDTPEEAARRDFQNTDATDKSMEEVDYFECFIRVDVDGDGEAELVRACYGGTAVDGLLDWEVWEDENPFDDIPCEPVPHRWDARSVSDKTIDLQDINTVLSRQFLNNLYWVNNPQRFAQGKIKNPEALDSPVFGQTVFGDVGATVTNLPVPFVGDKALLGLTHFDEVRQKRTGVGRQSMALDPEALQNQTAEASRNNRDASYSQVELVARNMAEWGWGKVFRKLMRLMIKHQDHPRTVMLNSKKQLVIDPRFWNADMNVTINVGLGTGSRDRDLMMLQNVLQSQLLLADRFMAAGAVDDAIDMLPLIIRTMEKMAESAGIKNPEDFYPEYTEEKVGILKDMAAKRAAQPPPEVVKEQAKIAATKEIEAMKAEGNAAKEQLQLNADLQTGEQDRQNAIEIERVKQDGEDRRFFAKLEQDRYLALLQASTQDVEEDGAPDAEGKPTKTKVRVVDNSAMVMDGISKLGDAIASMSAQMAAPTEVVRDQNGKVMGTRKVLN